MGTQESKPPPVPPSVSQVTLRCVVAGSGGVGKSSLCRAIVSGGFCEDYECSIEESFRKQVPCKDGFCFLDFLDMAGQEEFSCLLDQWFRRADILLLCFAIDSALSFKEMDRVVQQFQRVMEDMYRPILLVGCKADLQGARQVSLAQARAYQAEIQAWGYIETSAKMQTNLEQVTAELVRAMECATPRTTILQRQQAALQQLKHDYEETEKAIRLVKQLVSGDCGGLCLEYAGLAPLSPPSLPAPTKQAWRKAEAEDKCHAQDLAQHMKQRAIQEAEERARAPKINSIRCVDGEGWVLVQHQARRVQVKDLRVGDSVATGQGGFATIRAVFRDVLCCPRSLAELGGVLLTKGHPVLSCGEWRSAREVMRGLRDVEEGFELYNFELDNTHSIKVNSLVVATLGCDVGETLRRARPDLDQLYGLGWWQRPNQHQNPQHAHRDQPTP